MSSRRPSSGKSSQRTHNVGWTSRRRDDDDSDLLYECKAAYLVVADSVEDTMDSRKQLFHALQQSGRNPTRRMIDKHWPDDRDSMDFEEFCEVCRKVPATTEDDLLKAFRKIDINGDGYLSNSELRRVLTTKGEKMTEREVQDIIDEVDENKDGKLDYSEFCKMLLSTQDECKRAAIKRMEKKVKSGISSSSRSSASRQSSSPRPAERKKMDSSRKKYEESDDSDDDVVIGSTASLHRTQPKKDLPPTPKPRKTLKSSGSLDRGDTKEKVGASPRPKDYNRPAVSSKDLRLPTPKRLKNWKMVHRKGAFFFEEDRTIVGHQYDLKLSKDTSVWITIEPFSLRPGGDLNSAREKQRSPVDTMLMVLRDDGSLVTFTEMRDVRGKYGVSCELDRGKYQLIPMTTGCRFKPRTSEPSAETKLVKKKDDGYILTKAFKDALADIFELCDLDGNGFMSKEEFCMFNMRTSGDQMSDEEWSVVKENVELKNSELTRKGFIELNQMEAEDNEGDTDDLWVTLNSMGFNRNLVMDEACPFFMEVYHEEGEANVKVTGLSPLAGSLEKAIIEATIGKGEASRVKNMRDLNMHTYMTDFRACMVLENMSRSRVRVELDCGKSRNCTSNRKSLVQVVEVPPRTSVIGHHLMPAKETQEWTVRCQETVVK